MQTQAASGATSYNLDDYRVSQPVQIHTLLGQMAEQNVLLSLTAPRGVSYTTTIWEVDRERGVLTLGVEAGDRNLERVLQADDVLAVGYLDQVKIQFDVQNLMQVHGAEGESVLTCLAPRQLYRFQRRSNFRVRPLHNPPPVARFRPAAHLPLIELRVIDVSVSGVALLLPDNVAAFQAGETVKSIDIELDADTRFTAALKVMHLSPLRQEAAGARIGCELQGLNGVAMRALQRFIDSTQKKRRTMAWADK